MNDDAWIIELTCKHTVYFTVAPPMTGEDIYCVRCQAMQTVTRAPSEYRIRCRRCPYSRRFGAARVNAELAAMRHRRTRPDHRVGIYDGRRLIYVMGGDDGQPALFARVSDLADPPF